jgi:hypothetical protein
MGGGMASATQERKIASGPSPFAGRAQTPKSDRRPRWFHSSRPSWVPTGSTRSAWEVPAEPAQEAPADESEAVEGAVEQDPVRLAVDRAPP